MKRKSGAGVGVGVNGSSVNGLGVGVGGEKEEKDRLLQRVYDSNFMYRTFGLGGSLIIFGLILILAVTVVDVGPTMLQSLWRGGGDSDAKDGMDEKDGMIRGFARVRNGTETVAVLDFTDQAGGPAGIMERRMPMRLRNTPAKEWVAMSKWTPELFHKLTKASTGVFNSVIVSDDPTIIYYENNSATAQRKPLHVSVAADAPLHVKVAMDADEFFNKLRNKNGAEPFVYYVANSEHGDNVFAFAKRQVQPMDGFQLYPLKPRKISYQVWLGRSGLESIGHYDAAHNFYVQIFGRKRFYIMPPEEHAAMHLFPFLHPSDAHTQVLFKSASSTHSRFPGFRNLNVTAIDLSPGDVLYIPPYWLHHVVSLPSKAPSSTSESNHLDDNIGISVSVIQRSDEQALMAQLEGYDMPIDFSQPLSQRMENIAAFTFFLLQSLNLPNSVRELVESRYRHVPYDVSMVTSTKGEHKLTCNASAADLKTLHAQASQASKTVFMKISGRGCTNAGKSGSRSSIDMWGRAECGARELLLWNYLEVLFLAGLTGDTFLLKHYLIQYVLAGCAY